MADRTEVPMRLCDPINYEDIITYDVIFTDFDNVQIRFLYEAETLLRTHAIYKLRNMQCITV